jgi:hypothetical protein
MGIEFVAIDCAAELTQRLSTSSNLLLVRNCDIWLGVAGFDTEQTREPQDDLLINGSSWCRRMTPAAFYNAPRPEVVPGFITVGQAKRNGVAFGRNWDLSQRSAKHIAFDLRGPKTFTWRKPFSAR